MWTFSARTCLKSRIFAAGIEKYGSGCIVFGMENYTNYTLKVEKKYDLSEEIGKHARTWQKKKTEFDKLAEQIADLKDQQSKLQEKMDKDGENHVAATKGTDHAYEPKVTYTVVVL